MLGKNKIIKSLINNVDSETYKILRFCFYLTIIYASYISSALLVQKIYKTPYVRNNADDLTDGKPAQTDLFSNPFGIPLFTGFFGFAYGFVMYQIFQHNNSYVQQQNNSYTKQFIKLSGLQVAIHLILNLAIILTSFTTINLINCCNLLAVVIFAVFFGKADSKFKVQIRQIYVAVLITVGIIIFNIFSVKDHSSANKPLTLWTTLLVIFLLIIQGYRPQLTSQIRQKYSPPPSLFYYQVSKYSFIFLVISGILTTQLFQLGKFIWLHDRLAFDLTIVGILDMIGTIFIYRIVVLYKQHIVPMIGTVRKLLTSLINIWVFKHPVSNAQWIGFSIVIAAITLQLYVSFRQKRAKFKQISQNQENPSTPYTV